jgi:hypothetical protein
MALPSSPQTRGGACRAGETSTAFFPEPTSLAGEGPARQVHTQTQTRSGPHVLRRQEQSRFALDVTSVEQDAADMKTSSSCIHTHACATLWVYVCVGGRG